MRVLNVDVFTHEAGKGNPAAVVLDAGGLSGPEMAGIAARTGLETTFVDGRTLRYYLPAGQPMTLCGHGTLAAIKVMEREGAFTVSTPAGDLDVLAEEYRLGMAMPPVRFGAEADPAVAAAGLGIPAGEIDGPVQAVGAGRPKLLIPLRSLAVLDSLSPDPHRVDEACAATGTTGLYPFTRQERVFGATAEARHFSTGAGFAEDPVTGMAAVALAWFLWKHGVNAGCCSIKIAQGHAMGRPGMVTVRQELDGHTWIYGQAVIAGRMEV